MTADAADLRLPCATPGDLIDVAAATRGATCGKGRRGGRHPGRPAPTITCGGGSDPENGTSALRAGAVTEGLAMRQWAAATLRASVGRSEADRVLA